MRKNLKFVVIEQKHYRGEEPNINKRTQSFIKFLDRSLEKFSFSPATFWKELFVPYNYERIFKGSEILTTSSKVEGSSEVMTVSYYSVDTGFTNKNTSEKEREDEVLKLYKTVYITITPSERISMKRLARFARDYSDKINGNFHIRTVTF